MLHKGHYLVCGMPRSGKGQLMRKVAKDYRSAGIPVLYWTSKEAEKIGVERFVDRVFDDPNEFYTYAESVLPKTAAEGVGLILIIDEAADFQQTHPNELRKILNKWPAYGVECFVQVQRAKMVPPNVRNACDNVIAFKQRPDDARILAESYGDDLIHCGSESMPAGCFIQRSGIYGATVWGKSWEIKNGVFRSVADFAG